ncbi:MAG: CDP-alcohol phosphatidyltransferase family protein [SAR324 cluster bacterium]|nr:CDP-alcohol phosphatidyltransferase family protein [SAR324 cluster bacterium]
MVLGLNYMPLLEMVIYSVIPVSLTFLAERLFIFRLSHSPPLQKKLAQIWWLEPNNISRSRYIMGIVSVLIYHYGNEVFALYFFSFWMITDITDGSLAIYLKKRSTLGEIIDPLSDKLLYFPPLLYAAFQFKALDIRLALIFLIIDFTGQFTRSLFKVKGANLFGKTKTLLCTATLMLVFLQQTYLDQQLLDIGTFLLLGVIGLALCSIVFRIIPNYWYANILSLLNLCCGLLGIALVLMGYPLTYTFFLIFLGQFLDLLDGRAAAHWGSTARGEILDDLADGANFGLAVSFLAYGAIHNKWLAGFSAIFYFICTIFRLYRFIGDKKKANTPTGVEIFNGLPSPAAALFVGSTLSLLNDYCFIFVKDCQQSVWWVDWFAAGVACFSGLLMISHLPYIHIGRTLMKTLPKAIKIVLYALLIVASLIGLRFNNYSFLLAMIVITSSLYILLGVKSGK